MITSEILAEIDEKYPNALGTVSKVRKIDKLQKKLFRTVVKNTVTTSIEMLADEAFYTFTVHPSKIREILVDGKRYPYKQLEGNAPSFFCYTLKGGIGIYPTPAEDGEILVFHYEEPETLSTTDLNMTPDLDSDFHDLLVYGVCKELAEIDQRYDLANGFITQFKAELDVYNDANLDMEPAEIQEETWWT